MFADIAIVIEPMAIRAHELQTGRVRWRTETGEISGRGVITGSRLIQPRRAGGVAVVDLTNGSRHDGLLSSDAVFGTLIPCADGWISQTEQSLQHLPFLDRVREAAMTRWTTHPTEDSAVELAHLDLQAGDPVAARRRLLELSTDRARELQRDAILALLRQLSRRNLGNPATELDRQELGRELLNLSESEDDRLIALRALGEADLAANDSVGARHHF